METTASSAEKKRLAKIPPIAIIVSAQSCTVQFIETHISWVFIASPFVFKVKKPLDSGSSISARWKNDITFAKELALNRRLAPDVYLDVLPIYKMR